VQA
jgi:hypothetical protein